MKNQRVLFIVFALLILSNLTTLEYQLPKVLFLSTGDGDGRGTISDGLVIANEVFAKLGSVVRIENRKILHNASEMQQYSIIIAPTTYGYHDGDRQYSLSYLSDFEMQNLLNWVKNGGTLVSDVYIGRNKLDGQDRIDAEGKFSKSNWLMSECFGVELKELNMKGYSIIGQGIWKGEIVEAFSKDEWTPVITKRISSKMSTIAEWKKEESVYPALTVNSFHQGKAVLLGNFSMIHPAIDNGFSNSKEIANFYEFIYDLAVGENYHKLRMNVWEKGAESALCLSFNANGNQQQYSRVLRFLKKRKLPATFFLNAEIDKEIVKVIRSNDLLEIASNSRNRVDYRTLNYAGTMSELLTSESKMDIHPDGFRFPNTNNSFFGMLALQEMGYMYDSSIGVNHIEYYRGSVYPYNVPVFHEKYYLSLDLLEISQNLHDDWYYLKALDSNSNTGSKLDSDISKYDTYLKSLWNRAIRPNKGLMTIIAHPAYSGYNDKTLKVLENAVDRAENDGSWIANLKMISQRWNQLFDLTVIIKDEKRSSEISFSQTKRRKIKNLSFTLDNKPEKIVFKSGYSIKKVEDKYIVTLSEVNHGDILKLHYK